jgi:hypothetical protein
MAAGNHHRPRQESRRSDRRPSALRERREGPALRRRALLAQAGIASDSGSRDSTVAGSSHRAGRRAGKFALRVAVLDHDPSTVTHLSLPAVRTYSRTSMKLRSDAEACADARETQYRRLQQPRGKPRATSSASGECDVNTTAASTQLPDASASSVKWPG